MASTSKSSSQADNSALIEEFCSVTGSTKEKAISMLEMCHWNLEMAVNMHVDCAENPCAPPENQDSDGVRAPIPQTRGVLVEEDLTYRYGIRGRKRRPRSIFDGFRDFQAEARWQEYGPGERDENNPTYKRLRTLEDLFRPPLDIIHRGTFESARDEGKESNRWLMVNIQNCQEFACQVLNRDVWSNQTVKAAIRDHFVFWQVYSDSSDGERYMQFYKLNEFPYIAVIDPLTGEKLIEWQHVDATSICQLIDMFLKKYSTPNGASKPEKSESRNLLDESEEMQLKAALEASIKDSAPPTVDDDSEIETFDSDSESTNDKPTKPVLSNSDNSNDIDIVGLSESNDSCEAKQSWKDFLGCEEDPKTDLVLRLPDGKREQVSWPCSTQMKSLVLYVGELGYDPEKYELVTNYPRRNLCQLDMSKTLKDVDLYPREMIFVQLKS